MKISIIIPIYNEKNTIREILRRIEAVDLGEIKKEIIIVDDCSTDGTREILRELADRYKIIYQEKNQGKGAAVRAGFKAATGDYLVIQDADLEYDPQDYKLLLEPMIKNGAEVVYGSRMLSQHPHRVLFFWHYLGNKFLTALSNIFTNLALTDMETGYKMFTKKVIDEILPKLKAKRFGIEPELTARVAQGGYRIYEVGISYYGRSYAEGKKISWRDGLAAIWYVLKYNLLTNKMINFFKKHYSLFLLIFLLLFVLFFSLPHLTSDPALWYDEGLNIEIAHNFLLFHQLNIATAPGVFADLPYVIGTNGYPLTIPLAGFFSLFGFGFEQARLYMVVWLLFTVLTVYYVAKAFFGKASGLIAVALVVTFSTFYGIGLSATGEAPGLVLLLWGLFFLFKKENYWLAGIFLGLAAVAKPSINLNLLPAFFLFLILIERKKILRRLFQFSLGVLPPLLVWIWLAFPQPLALATWRGVWQYYEYPHGLPLTYGLRENLLLFFSDSTLIYFLLLTLVVIISFFVNYHDKDFKEKRIIQFFLIFGLLDFLYFLRGPGYLRYLFSLQFLLLILVYPSLLFLFKALKNKKIFSFLGNIKLWAMVITGLILIVHLLTLLFFNNRTHSQTSLKVTAFVNEQLKNDNQATVGIIDIPEIAAFIDYQRKFQIAKVAHGIHAFGDNPLSFSDEKLPKLLVYREENQLLDPYRQALTKKYSCVRKIGGYIIAQLYNSNNKVYKKCPTF